MGVVTDCDDDQVKEAIIYLRQQHIYNILWFMLNSQ